jgi:hypothetical protein
MTKSYAERVAHFFSKVQRPDGEGCWLWLGAPTARGYGRFWDGTRDVPAHRFSYEYFRGAADPELLIDHLCRNRLCVNPDHLDLVTSGENTRRGLSYQHSPVYVPKAACPAGHEYTERNTLWIKRAADAEPHRRCKKCHNEITRRYRAKKRLLAS